VCGGHGGEGEENPESKLNSLRKRGREQGGKIVKPGRKEQCVSN